jgi:hypothetical protein
MAYGIAGCIGHEILLRNVGDIFGFGVFGEEVVKGLVLVRPDVLWNRLPPFFGIRENRIHVIDDPPERIFPVPHNLAYSKLRDTRFHRRNEGAMRTSKGDNKQRATAAGRRENFYIPAG